MVKVAEDGRAYSFENKVKVTFEWLQYSCFKDYNVNGKPLPEIDCIEVDHDKRTIAIYFHGDITRAEGQECHLVNLVRDEDATSK